MENLKKAFNYATEIELAELLGKEPRSIANDRSRGEGPPYIKVGKTILYPLDRLRKYLDARIVTPKAAPTLIDAKPRIKRPALPKAA